MAIIGASRLRIGIAFVLGLLTVGCTANQRATNIERSWSKPKVAVVSVDARQRAILGAPVARADTSRGQMFCAEPSPDVYAVVAQALSTSAALGKGAEARTLQAELAAAFSSAENASTIPRTQTINMLRELMYRTCERYLNGGITEDELPIQAVRDQRIMVAILAIEQLTGAVVAKPVAIGAESTAGQGFDSAALVLLDSARKSLQSADSELAKAKDAVKKLNANDADGTLTCTAIDAAVAKQQPLTAPQEAHQKKCVQAKLDLATATANQAEAAKFYAAMLSMGNSAGQRTDASVTKGVEGGIVRAHTESVAQVTRTIEMIWQGMANDGTEVLLACIRTLSRYQGALEATAQRKEGAKAQLDALKPINDTCTSYLQALVAEKTAEREAGAAEARARIEAAGASIRSDIEQEFKGAWVGIAERLKTPELRTAFVTKLRKLLGPNEAHKAECFKLGMSEAEAEKCFAALRKPVREAISEGNHP